MPGMSHPPLELLYGKRSVLLQEERGGMDRSDFTKFGFLFHEGLHSEDSFLFFTIFCGIAKFVHLRLVVFCFFFFKLYRNL